ncbi:Conserved_hypothetical protein [Hexamita inflata]|uniref:Transmembrane protein n=1 Tax=Hexamita inflata TaxID=28002 RepID=A0ABP1L7G4_9EUKA
MRMQLFPRVSTFTYLLQSYVPSDSVPAFVEIINTESAIFKEYYSQMYQRMERYPNVQYVFLTQNTKNQVYAFMAKFPLFLNKVNVAVYTFEIQKMFNTCEIPFCCILNEKSVMMYTGTISTINFDVTISRLNEMHCEQKINQKIKKLDLSNNQLSLVLSGITSKHQNKHSLYTIVQKQIRKQASFTTLEQLNKSTQLKIPITINNHKQQKSSKYSISSQSENSSQGQLIEQLFQQVCGRRLIELRGLFYVINFVETKQCQACQYFHFANNQQNSRKRLQPFNRQITIFVFNIYQNILFVFQITLFIFINVCVPSYVILFTNMRFITLWTQMISFARTHISAITLFAADTLRTYFCIYMIVFICFYYWSFNWAYYWLVTTFNFSWCSFNFIFCQIYFHLINYAFNIIRYFNFFIFWMQQFHQRKPINQYYLHKINKHPCGPTSTSSWKLNIFCKLVYVINSFIIIIVVTNYFRLFSGNTTRTYKFLHLTGLFHKF